MILDNVMSDKIYCLLRVVSSESVYVTVCKQLMIQTIDVDTYIQDGP